MRSLEPLAGTNATTFGFSGSDTLLLQLPGPLQQVVLDSSMFDGLVVGDEAASGAVPRLLFEPNQASPPRRHGLTGVDEKHIAGGVQIVHDCTAVARDIRAQIAARHHLAIEIDVDVMKRRQAW